MKNCKLLFLVIAFFTLTVSSCKKEEPTDTPNPANDVKVIVFNNPVVSRNSQPRWLG